MIAGQKLLYNVVRDQEACSFADTISLDGFFRQENVRVSAGHWESKEYIRRGRNIQFAVVNIWTFAVPVSRAERDICPNNFAAQWTVIRLGHVRQSKSHVFRDVQQEQRSLRAILL